MSRASGWRRRSGSAFSADSAACSSPRAFCSSLPRVRDRLVPWLVSYAVGALLGVALLDLLPQALRGSTPRRVFGTLLLGILGFFVLEKLAIWRHCHTHDCDVHRRERRRWSSSATPSTTSSTAR